ELADAARAQAVRSDAVIAGHDLADTGQPGERWDGEPPATLERVLFHLVQEYARHLGHLDIVSALAGGQLGEQLDGPPATGLPGIAARHPEVAVGGRMLLAALRLSTPAQRPADGQQREV